MARKKAKYCTSCEMKFMGNHVCTGLNKKVLYDDPIMQTLEKKTMKGPDSKMDTTDGNNTGTV